MPHFACDEIEKFVNDSISHAAMPPGSPGWRATPNVIGPLIEGGDLGDAWVFTCGVVQYIVRGLGLEHAGCPHGDPNHEQRVMFGFVPVNADGSESGGVIFPDEMASADVPPQLADQVIPASLLAKMITAEMNDDPGGSLAVWDEANELHLCGYVISLAIRQAGDIRRAQVAQSGSN